MAEGRNRQNYDPVHEVQQCAKQLQRVYRLAAQRDASFLELLGDVTERLDTALEFDREAALAASQSDSGLGYPQQHALQTAVWGGVLLALLEEQRAARRSTIAAGLTANLSILALQRELEGQSEPPSDQQREQIREHPRHSARLLEILGVEDPLWIRAVQEHHERLDGSGYPEGLAGEAIARSALALGFAEAYSAMTTPRAHRKSQTPAQALLELRGVSGQHFPEEFVQRLLSMLGLYLPGTLVRLDDGSIAMAVRWGAGPREPQVCVLVAPNGRRIFQPLTVQSGSKGQPAVERGLPLGAVELPMNVSLVYGYTSTLWR